VSIASTVRGPPAERSKIVNRFLQVVDLRRWIADPAIVAEARGDMDSNWFPGLNIFYDGTGNETFAAALRTDESAHLIGLYSSAAAPAARMILGRVQAGNGVLLGMSRMAVFSERTQKDIAMVAVEGSDEFVAIWASEYPDAYNRIYVRNGFIHDRFGIGTPFAETQISGSNGHYVCPRIVYNAEHDLIFACWVSQTDQELQGLWLRRDILEAASYPISITTALHAPFLTAYGNVEINHAVDVNIVVMRHGDDVIVGLQESASKINFYRVSMPAAGNSTVTLMTSYSQSDMGKFHADFDPVNNQIMLVYIGTDSFVYGERLRVFGRDGAWRAEATPGRDGEALAPTRLNAAVHAASFPFIAAAPVQNEAAEFLVAWSAGVQGTYVNRFNSDFNPVRAEQAINAGDTLDHKNPRIVTSANQFAVLFRATRYNNIDLRGEGVLAYVAAHTAMPPLA
jgi:hypothetical protein